jgi:hypothetical protein
MIQCPIRQARGRVYFVNADGRHQIFTSPELIAQWPHLGENGTLGHKFVGSDLRKARQEICGVPLASNFCTKLHALEKQLLSTLHRQSTRIVSFEEFSKAAVSVVKVDRFRASAPVVNFQGTRLPVVVLQDIDGNDIRTSATAIGHGDRVKVRFQMSAFLTPERAICHCRLLSVTRLRELERRPVHSVPDYTSAVE